MTPATAPSPSATTTAATATPAPAPRWARRTAHAIALCALPSGLWRLAMASGIYVGYSDEVLRDEFGIPGWGIAYVVGLTVLQEIASLLPLLLVTDRRRFRRPKAVAITAASASAFATLLALSQVVVYFTVESQTFMSDTANTVAGFVFAPLFVIGPLLGAVTRSYWKRHRA
ncbi:hypothetical protein OG883_29870 [Streptomyces sp. NBC_01142]|uniref:hypothetical protein n=1 Tax=Streptomyces sp. NBC_01142 TaxID=2975865 RepID=UPI00224DE674|nr:hypothetical protein [Streptomyces sp. NBC_01142]MCX4824010.1 hypothetical protein [Streptomyces sp. NBC_01142]